MFVQGAEMLTDPISGKINQTLQDNRSSNVFRIQGVEGQYLDSLTQLFSAAEKKGGPVLKPAQFPKIGIKIKTKLAPGLQVSKEFVNAMLEMLSERGFRSDQIFLVDRERASLVRAGFLPSFHGNKLYRGFQVFSLTHESYTSPIWFHDSPMPPTLHDRARFFLKFPHDREKRLAEERKSYLPSILFLDDVFWINLAVCEDSLNIGIDGAATNMSTGAISNYYRFLEKPTLAPAAVTEILAIPEIWEKRTYSIVDLSKFQFAGGGQFDAEFLGHESTLLLSENPLSVDRIALKALNAKRKQKGFTERLSDELLLFKYGKELGLSAVSEIQVFDVR